MIKVGVTGGIGSGKSTVCRIFESLGIPVYSADKRAKELIQSDSRLIEGYRKLFGPQVYAQNGRFNKEIVTEKIFKNRQLLDKVNALVHPVVREDFENWSARQSTSYIIKEAAILIESGGKDTVDKVVLVSAPDDLRILRVMERDHASREEVQARINNQWSRKQLRRFCDFEVCADDIHLVIPQVLEIHKGLLK